MKIGSLFDGSGGFPLAGIIRGGIPVWRSEVEPYPIAVTKSRFPNMVHLGDVQKVNGAEVEPVDVMTFGSPCQDLSVAGKRAGLKHTENGDEETTRSGLFMEPIRIIKEMRYATDGLYPTFAVWENVPGAFSSNKGEDFRVVLEELARIKGGAEITIPKPDKWRKAGCIEGDGWSIAWRTFDAQHWGVAQRRKRIYLVADFRGGRAAKILFEREGLRGYFEKGRETRQTAAANTEGSTGADDSQCIAYNGENITSPLNKTNPQPGDPCHTLGTDSRNYLVYCLQGNGIDRADTAGCNGKRWREDASYTLNTIDRPAVVYAVDRGGGKSACNWTENKTATLTCTHGGEPAIAYGIGSYDSNAMKSDNPHSGFYEARISKTLDLNGGNPSCNQGGIAIVQVVDCWNQAVTGDKTARIRASAQDNDHIPCVVKSVGVDLYNGTVTGDVAATLSANSCATNSRNGPYVAELVDSSKVVYAVENHPADSRVNIDESGKCKTLTGRMGTGGGNVPMVMHYGFPLGFRLENVKLYEECATTLCNGTRAGFTTGVVISDTYQKVTGPLMANSHPGGYTGQDAYSDMLVTEKKNRRYIVRRLTPTECARLQGFPDRWGHPDKKESLTDEEYSFWQEVRDTYADINGKQKKQYSRENMLKWYNKLHTDSSEYKMWGNGIALPNALYVMQGIAKELLKGGVVDE